MFALHRPRFALRLATLTVVAGAAAIGGVIQTSAQDLPAFTCTDKSGGAASAAGTVTGIRIAHHDGYDRLVIDFSSGTTAVPQYDLTRQNRSTFVRDASGQPILLGLLAVTAGLTIAGLRRFARK